MENKEGVYITQLAHVIEELDALAEKHHMPYVLVVQVSDGAFRRSAFIPPDAHKEMRQLWRWLSLGDSKMGNAMQ